MNKLLRVLLVFFVCVPAVYAASFSQSSLSSAYIFNFLKQVNWPDEGNKKHYTVAVLADKSTFDALKATLLEQQQAKNKPIKLTFVNALANMGQAEVLVIPESQNKHLTAIAATLRQSQTLLITTNSENKRDTMINLVIDQVAQKMTFEINKSNILYEGLTITNQLLLLGGSEIDVATLYRETENAMLATKERERQLTQQLNERQNELALMIKSLRGYEERNQQLKVETLNNQATLKDIKQQFTEQQQAIKNKEAMLQDSSLKLDKANIELASAQRQLSDALSSVEQQQLILKSSAEQQQTMRALIADNEQTLAQQQKLISDNNNLIEQKTETIYFQRLMIAIIVTSSCLLIFFFIKYVQTNRKLAYSLAHLRSAQSLLVESEKMAALGNLVAGISHEINTPIGIGVTAASHLKDKVTTISAQFEQGKISKSNFVTFVDESIQATNLLLTNLEKAGDLIASFKRISVDNAHDELIKVDVYRVIKDTVDSIRFAHKKQKVNVDFHCDKDIRVNTYPGILSQIINNLMNNALLHAFEKQRPLNTVAITVTAEQKGFKVKFQDNGKGISNEDLASIFEPFFTTKRKEGGSGLGLHIVQTLINEKLASSLNYGSQLNEGTWFEFYLYDLKTKSNTK